MKSAATKPVIVQALSAPATEMKRQRKRKPRKATTPGQGERYLIGSGYDYKLTQPEKAKIRGAREIHKATMEENNKETEEEEREEIKRKKREGKSSSISAAVTLRRKYLTSDESAFWKKVTFAQFKIHDQIFKYSPTLVEMMPQVVREFRQNGLNFADDKDHMRILCQIMSLYEFITTPKTHLDSVWNLPLYEIMTELARERRQGPDPPPPLVRNVDGLSQFDCFTLGVAAYGHEEFKAFASQKRQGQWRAVLKDREELFDDKEKNSTEARIAYLLCIRDPLLLDFFVRGLSETDRSDLHIGVDYLAVNQLEAKVRYWNEAGPDMKQLIRVLIKHDPDQETLEAELKRVEAMPYIAPSAAFTPSQPALRPSVGGKAPLRPSATAGKFPRKGPLPAMYVTKDKDDSSEEEKSEASDDESEEHHQDMVQRNTLLKQVGPEEEEEESSEEEEDEREGVLRRLHALAAQMEAEEKEAQRMIEPPAPKRSLAEIDQEREEQEEKTRKVIKMEEEDEDCFLEIKADEEEDDEEMNAFVKREEDEEEIWITA